MILISIYSKTKFGTQRLRLLKFEIPNYDKYNWVNWVNVESLFKISLKTDVKMRFHLNLFVLLLGSMLELLFKIS